MKFLGPAVTGEKPFENVDRKLTCALWPRSPNDLDLKNFIVVEFERTVVSKSTIATKNPFFDFFSIKWQPSWSHDPDEMYKFSSPRNLNEIALVVSEENPFEMLTDN